MPHALRQRQTLRGSLGISAHPPRALKQACAVRGAGNDYLLLAAAADLIAPVGFTAVITGFLSHSSTGAAMYTEL
jgi:hypothetical protein